MTSLRSRHETFDRSATRRPFLRRALATSATVVLIGGGLVIATATPAWAPPFCSLPTTATGFSVDSEADLVTLSTDGGCWGSQIVQTVDIALSAPNANIASIGTDIIPFTGTYSGQQHSITGLAITGSDHDRGLFGSISNATVQNLSVTGSVTGNYNIGGVIGSASASTIADVSASVDVSGGEFLGGVVGSITDSTVLRVSASGSVTGTIQGIGGIAGYSVRSTITDSSATGAITGGAMTGGAAGTFSSGTISTSSASGAVTCTDYCGGLIGAIGGIASSTIDQTFSTGLVTGSDRVGGLIGGTSIQTGLTLTLSNSYRRGDVTNSANTVAGLLIGRQRFDGQVNITDVYATGAVVGASTPPYAFIGESLGNTPAVITDSFDQAPPNPPDLTSITTFTDAGWDIDENWTTPTVWGICSDVNDGLPFLKAFHDVMGPCSPPEISRVTPYEGTIAGGDVVTLTGTRLNLVTAVKFGDVDCASFTIVSNTEITCVTPAHTAGWVDVTIQYLDGGTTSEHAFEFVIPTEPDAPVVPAFTG